MRRSDHPSRPSARICCCVSLSKTLLMPVTELAFRPDVNVSIATGNGRFSAVDQWPVLGVHRGLTSRSSGIDLALHIVDRYVGREIAQTTATNMEYEGQGWKTGKAASGR